MLNVLPVKKLLCGGALGSPPTMGVSPKSVLDVVSLTTNAVVLNGITAATFPESAESPAIRVARSDTGNVVRVTIS